MRKISVYTDGSYIASTGSGGFGVLIVDGKNRTENIGSAKNTTSNRMELTAVITALNMITGFHFDSNITIYSDSQYVINAIQKGWLETWAHSGWVRYKGAELKNADLWHRLYPLLIKTKAKFEWVPGHSGNKFHNRAHELAYRAAKE